MDNETELNPMVATAIKVLLIIIGVTLFAWGVSGVFKRFDRNEKVRDQAEHIKDFLKSDMEAIENKNTDPVIVGQALRRLGTYRHRAGIAKAKELIHSKNDIIRRAALEVLGYDNSDDSIDILIANLDDPNEKVRNSVIHALSKKRGSEKAKQALVERLAKPSISDLNKIEIYKSLFSIETELQKRHEIVADILNFVSSTDDKVAQFSVAVAMNLEPHNQKLIETLKEAVNQNNNPQLMALAIYHLSALHNAWFKSKLAKYITNSNYGVKMAVLNAIPQSCPEGMWKMLWKFLASEKNKNLIEVALRLPRHIGGDKAKSFLQKLLDQTQVLGATYHPLIREELTLLKSTNREPACHNEKK